MICWERLLEDSLVAIMVLELVDDKRRRDERWGDVLKLCIWEMVTSKLKSNLKENSAFKETTGVMPSPS